MRRAAGCLSTQGRVAGEGGCHGEPPPPRGSAPGLRRPREYSQGTQGKLWITSPPHALNPPPRSAYYPHYPGVPGMPWALPQKGIWKAGPTLSPPQENGFRGSPPGSGPRRKPSAGWAVPPRRGGGGRSVRKRRPGRGGPLAGQLPGVLLDLLGGLAREGGGGGVHPMDRLEFHKPNLGCWNPAQIFPNFPHASVVKNPVHRGWSFTRPS